MKIAIRARDLSTLLGVSEKTLSQWVLAGRLVRLRHGVYDLRQSFRAFVRLSRPRRAAELAQIIADQQWADEHLRPLAPGTIVELFELSEKRHTLKGRRLGRAVFDGTTYVFTEADRP
jgi:hypothetical protein